MKAIITVVGKDKAGIVAGVATKVAELGLNIDDISQTVCGQFCGGDIPCAVRAGSPNRRS